MFVSYDSDADAVYVRFERDAPEVVETREIDTWRYADYGADGTVIGIEFLRASHGIDLEGVPHATEVREAIRALPDLADRFLRAAS